MPSGQVSRTPGPADDEAGAAAGVDVAERVDVAGSVVAEEARAGAGDVRRGRWRRLVQRLGAVRDRLRADPRTRGPYRVGVGVVGGLVTLVGLVTVPLPGQGWLTVFLGLAILSTEFAWARRLRERGMRWFRAWTAWMSEQGLAVRGLVGLATLLVVALCTWAALALTGVPGWVPAALVPPLPGLR